MPRGGLNCSLCVCLIRKVHRRLNSDPYKNRAVKPVPTMLLLRPLRIYRPSLVLLQWRLFALYFTVQSALKRHHWGRGRFWRAALARIFLILNVFWEGMVRYLFGWGGEGDGEEKG